MWVPPKIVTIYADKKTGFDCKNKYRGDKLAYFWLVD